MIELLKYIRGYLRIRIWGFSPERFMNLCSNKGILLWDIVRDGEVYYMNITLKGFFSLRPIAKKTGTRVAVLQRYGLPFFLPKLLRRKMFLAGLFLTVAFWIWSSTHIWNIELEGNYQITQDVFNRFLKENQVSEGMRKDLLDIEVLEKEIRRQFPQVTWASAKLEGTKLRISIKENDAPIITDTEEKPVGKNLLSQYEGTVVSVMVRSGVPMVAAGDTVEVGTVLVEGRVPVYNDDGTLREYIYVDADADVILEHTQSFTDSLPFDYIKKEYTGREEKRYYFRLGDKEWKMPEDRPFLVYDSLIKESRALLFQKLSIPFYTGSYTHREYQNVEYEYTLDEAKILLNQKISEYIASLEEKGVQIIEKDVKIETSQDSWVVSGEFLVQELVGVSAEIGQSGPEASEAGQPDSGVSGEGQPDPGAAGAGQPDSGVSGEGQPDQGAAGAGQLDSGVSGEGQPDPGAAGAGAVEPGSGETGSAETQSGETRLAEPESGATDPAETQSGGTEPAELELEPLE